MIVSPDEMNRHLGTIVICPITSKSKNYPTRVQFSLEGRENWIVIDQIRTIDKTRIAKAIGALKEETKAKVKAVIKEAYVD